MIYKWRNEEIQYAVSPSVVGKIFEKIEKKEGSVTNKAVLDVARSEKSPIHSLFEWDDTKAAEKYRLNQANRLICNLMVEVEEGEMEGPVTVRALVNTSAKREGSFINIMTAMDDDDIRDRVLSDALRELEAFRNKYRNLSELAKVFAAIAEVTTI